MQTGQCLGPFLSGGNIDFTKGLVFTEMNPAIVVNDLVTFDPFRSTFTFTPGSTGCPDGFVGTFSFEAKLTNVSAHSLSDLVVAVTTLTDGSLSVAAALSPWRKLAFR